jgi:hypothetical protein
MKRLVPVALAALLTLTLTAGGVPAASAALHVVHGTTLSAQQSEELVASYVRLTGEFYKKVDRQAMLDGARTSMIDYLKKHKVANATLPALHAGDDDVTNTEALNREVSTAVGEYATKLEPVESMTGSTQITYAAIAGVLGSVKDRYTVFSRPRSTRAQRRASTARRSAASASRTTIDDATKNICTSRTSSSTDRPTKPGLQPDDMISAINGKPVSVCSHRHHRRRRPKALDRRTERVTAQCCAATRARGAAHDRARRQDARSGDDHARDDPSTQRQLEDAAQRHRLRRPLGLRPEPRSELNAALRRLDSQGAKAYVLDLRYNGGGYLNAAVDVSSKFIAERSDRHRAIARRQRHRVRRRELGDRAAAARGAGERLHRVGLGDHRRRDPGQRRRHAHRPRPSARASCRRSSRCATVRR